MSRAFQWKDEYSVGNETLDDQHRLLLEIVRELHSAMAAGHGNDVAGNVLLRLADYSVVHFAAEEDLMKKHGFPQLAAHRAEHRTFTEEILAFKKAFEAGSVNVTPDLVIFLQHWLHEHTQGSDQKYSEFLTSRGTH
jgi:hemerythrin